MRAALLFLIRSAAAGGIGGGAADAAAPVFDAFAARLDGDGDGGISAEEYAALGEPAAFADIDADADGVVSRRELRAWITLTPPRPPTRDPEVAGAGSALGVAVRTPPPDTRRPTPIGSESVRTSTGIGRLRAGNVAGGHEGWGFAAAAVVVGFLFTAGRIAIRSRRFRRWLL